MRNLYEDFQLRWKNNYKSRRSFIVSMLTGGVVVAVILVTISILVKKVNKVGDTYNKELNGRIYSVYENKGHSWVNLKDNYSAFIIFDSSSFVLVNSSNYNYDCPELYNFLQVGDSIHKPIYTDSLFIYRDNQKYMFILGDLYYNFK